ncbi:hypothetical protein JTB14_006347 [Gonioctena quinquepunctata]|nr:hypothetical protein JTB14_006347 [Gonioctena quinquepunctata]
MSFSRKQKEGVDSVSKKGFEDALINRDFMENFAKNLAKMVYSELSDKIEGLTNQIKVLTTEVISLKKLNSALKSKVDFSEQKSKMCHLKLFGLKERRGENLKEAVSKLFEGRNIMTRVEMSSQMSCHHLGAFLSSSNEPRGVMMNFTIDSLRNRAFMNEKQLRGP